MDFKVQMHCDLFSILSFKIHVVTLILEINLESYMQIKPLFNNTSSKKKKKKKEHPQDLRNWYWSQRELFFDKHFSVIGFSFLDSLVTFGPVMPSFRPLPISTMRLVCSYLSRGLPSATIWGIKEILLLHLGPKYLIHAQNFPCMAASNTHPTQTAIPNGKVT